MRPARRRIPVRRSSVIPKRFPLGRIVFIPLVFLLVFIFFRKETKFWNGSDKVALAINNGDSVLVTTFDPKADSISEIVIPGDTQVEVARSLGTFRLKSVWQLGIQEKIGGSLLAKTITKNFDFPLFVWADSGASGFSRGDGKSLLAAVFSPYPTNLGIGDKIRLALFSLGVKNLNKTNIDLRDTGFVKKAKLIDGEAGYAISGNIPEKLVAVFSDNEVGALSLKTIIKDSTGRQGISQEVGEIIEVLGPKVAGVTKENINIDNCEVSGRYKNLVTKVARIFDCKIGKKFNDNFDLEITLGKSFPERF